MNPGNTGAERATYIKSRDWTKLVVIARFTNETTYASTDSESESEGGISRYPLEHQNTTFTVEEVLFNRDPNLPLENSVDIQPDGTLVVHKSTVTTCCLCGRSMSAEDIGEDYLLEISTYGDSLSSCDITCRIGDGSGLCDDTADELRAGMDNLDHGDDVDGKASITAPASTCCATVSDVCPQDMTKEDTIVIGGEVVSTPNEHSVLSVSANICCGAEGDASLIPLESLITCEDEAAPIIVPGSNIPPASGSGLHNGSGQPQDPEPTAVAGAQNVADRKSVV